LAGVLATGAIGGAGSAMSAEIAFGDLTPNGGIATCTHSGSDPGFVCPQGTSFTTSGATFTATGFNNPFDPAGGGFVTLKPHTSPPGPPTNSFQESGLGENATAPGTPCSNFDCEINAPSGLSLSVTGGVMNDAIIGSVQVGESFNFFYGPGMTFLGTFAGGSGACTGNTFSDTCVLTFPDSSVIWLQANNADVLITTVSGNFGTVPEPASMALLGSALLGFGLLRRRRHG